jgi:hypothetical protein
MIFIVLYTPNFVTTHVDQSAHDINQSAHDITEFCSVNMDVWYYRISVACDIME